MNKQVIENQQFNVQDISISVWDSGNTGDRVDRAQRQTDFFNRVALWKISQEIDHQKRRAREQSAKGLAGLCEKCGKRIPKARLQANRRATRCVRCQEVYERNGE